MNIFLVLIIGFLVATYLLDIVVELLNLKSLTPTVPMEFSGVFDADKYKQSQLYLLDQTRFGLIQESLGTAVTLLFIVMGGFNWMDIWVRAAGLGPIITGVLFFAALSFFSGCLSFPFTLYGTFVIEEKFGFNKTTVRTFILDLIKGLILAAVLGAPLLAGILWFFGTVGVSAWIWCWVFVTLIQLVLMVVAPVLLMPLFNKFEPLEEGDLKRAITTYAKKEGFEMSGVFKMDGSKRSSKSNAFFTGLGKYRRIVLFDTLIANHTVDELLAIIAHEMGHYKKRHIYKTTAISLGMTGVMFFVLSLFLNNPELFDAFKMQNLSIYASLVLFSFLFSPISKVLGIFSAMLSRKHEYEADAYAAQTIGGPEALISGLKKLSVDNFSNLTPHPLKVFLEYSHPPVLLRISALKKIKVS
ncbi:MAG: STE24 endopeptidase [Candidatus Marinamargulisbacteria bacterium]|jgi:STE24 endopeptidase